MAWTTLYYHEYYDTAGNACRLDIKEDAAAVNTLVEAAPVPIKLIRPAKDILNPVKGDGCVINLMSQTDRQFIGLFTADMDQYRIEHRVATVLTWFGYLNTEMYRESYSEVQNYYVELSGNNGFALLDRYKFLDGSGDPYTGLKTQWEIIQIILGYWGLMDLVSLLSIGIGTTSTEITIGGTETIFHHTYVSCHNYYDEDGEPMTCRQVMEEILKPYGAIMQMFGAWLIITDIDSLASDISFKNYNNDFTWNGSSSSLASNVLDLETVGYYDDGSVLEVLPGVNRQVIRYSKYTPESLDANIDDLTKMTFSSPLTSPQWTQLTQCGATSYLADEITALENWTFALSAPYTVSGAREDLNSDPEYFIRMNQPNSSAPYTFNYYDDDHSAVTFPAPFVVGNTGYYLKITGKMFPLTREDPYVEQTTPCGDDDADFTHAIIEARIVVGDFLYQRNTKTWIDYPGTIQAEHQIRIYGGNSGENCKNKWNDFKVEPWINAESKYHPVADDGVYVYLEPGVYGQVRIEFTRQIYAYINGSWDEDQSINIQQLWIKDLEVAVVRNPSFEPINHDIEYVGELNQDWKNEGEEITLMHGCSAVDGSPFDNGALIYKDGSDDYYLFSEWTRGGQTAVLEKLLLNTVQSNRESAAVKLTVNINNTAGVHSLRYIDAAYMSGKMFMVTGSVLNPADGSEQIELIEITQDTHTIS